MTNRHLTLKNFRWIYAIAWLILAPMLHAQVDDLDPNELSLEELNNLESELVVENDPFMQEIVGTIRIPEMGTNEVLEMLQEYTNKPILRQQNLPATRITFFSQGPLTRGQTIRAIESLLAMNGIAVTPLGDLFIKAVPSSVITAQGAPVWEGTTLNAVPTQKIYEKLFELNFLNAPEAVPLVQPVMSQGAPIAFDKSGYILISDALINLQRIERLLKLIDAPGKLRSKMLFFQLDNTGAQDVLRRLQQMQSGALKRRLENNTTFDADDRTNQIIVFTHPSNEELITQLIKQIDVDVAPMTTTRVFQIRYASAEKVVSIIDQVVSGQKQARDQATGTGSRTSGAAAQAAAARRSTEAAAARSEASNLQFSDFLTIVPDERANTIVASGTHNDMRHLDELIAQIDSLLAQVRIEVIITEVRLEQSDVRGIDSFDFRYNMTGVSDSGNFSGSEPGGSQRTLLTGGNVYGARIPAVTWGPDGFSMQAILRAIRTKSNVSVLSTPTIVTTHNKEASVSVGEERPILIGTTESGVTGSITNNIQYRDVKLELKVTPLIGIDGVIQMEISQSVQNIIGNPDIAGEQRPVIGTRRAESYVSVRDGELVVLGGLQAYDTAENDSRMPFLSHVPILGNAFKRKTQDRTRTELLIFIRPTIVRDTDQAHTDARNLVDVLQAQDDIDRYLETGTFRDRPKEEDDEDEETTVRRRQPGRR
jgi:general secretion pathway protein D